MTSVVKAVKRYGNSGGVYVPSKWIGGKVKVELIEEPLDPRHVLARIPLEHVISAILYGSYARKESLEGSDMDILLVVDDDSKISIAPELKQKYDIQIKSLRNLRNALVHDPVFYKIIKDEAVAILNHQFLDSLKKEAPKTIDIKKRIELAESSLNITKEILKIGGDIANLVYPLIMRLKEILLIEYFLEDKKYSTKALKHEILDCGITSKEFSLLMDIYRTSRNGKRIPKTLLSTDTITKITLLLENKIQYVKQKAREKRD
ncbi:MAG: nucleotidyltransferase domain-containing protein [Candidatus Aenigmarchaeota archaeon]|nr:nucleotidyltransferase domain-containing protein [Candidatus Aenigmarchaeota archaeon]